MLQNKVQQALRNAKNRGEDEGGFTLIELLVVILIIGILAAIALPTFLGQSDKAKDSSAKSDARNAISQIESCLADGKTVAVCIDPDENDELGQFKHFVTGYPAVAGTGGYAVRTNARPDKTNAWFQIAKADSPGGYVYTAGADATGAEAWVANSGTSTDTDTP